MIDEHLIRIPAGKLPPDVKTCKDDVIRPAYISDISEDTDIPFIVVKHCRRFKTISFTVQGEPGTAWNAATGSVGRTNFNL